MRQEILQSPFFEDFVRLWTKHDCIAVKSNPNLIGQVFTKWRRRCAELCGRSSTFYCSADISMVIRQK